MISSQIRLNDSFMNWTDLIIKFNSLIQWSSWLNNEHQGWVFSCWVNYFFMSNQSSRYIHVNTLLWENVSQFIMFAGVCAFVLLLHRNACRTQSWCDVGKSCCWLWDLLMFDWILTWFFWEFWIMLSEALFTSHVGVNLVITWLDNLVI